MSPVDGENSAQNAIGCFGQALSLIGFAWAGLVVLGGLGILDRLGLSPALLAGLAGSIIPAFFFIAVGRAIRSRSRRETRRASTTGASPRGPVRADPSGRRPKPPATPPVLPGRKGPGPAIPPPIPAPVPRPAVRDESSPNPPVVTARMDDPPAPVLEDQRFVGVEYPSTTPRSKTSGMAKPKTSQEMIEEARKKWGTKNR
ncbi:MAG: hypothetical protein WB245_07190 [Acidimicrobiia bacterium]